eukprot:TRINITY_DN21933_c0_g1_i1.p1 TRINITY_DN21933_c0_g1~~TRINITY_DN21933_c0_g1_i1.p1  ORF type:complete len:285 (-),score=36.76 TRINITY_DN21933_c0_g1_i1:69-923(-)
MRNFHVALGLCFVGETLAVYTDLGERKCQAKDGQRLRYSYHAGKGEICEQLCDENSECGGYSVSSFANCIIWEDTIDNLIGGGEEWGGAHCIVREASHQAARGTCSCTDISCPWIPAPECTPAFRYMNATYAGCTTADNVGQGWCSWTPDYEDEKWSNCQRQCPIDCYWRPPGGCVPKPKQEACWQAPEACAAEFWYKGRLYAGCTLVDSEGGIAWCSHSHRFATQESWSSCTRCCTSGSGSFALLAIAGWPVAGYLFFRRRPGKTQRSEEQILQEPQHEELAE